MGRQLVQRLLQQLAGLYSMDRTCDPELATFYQRLGFGTCWAWSYAGPPGLRPV